MNILVPTLLLLGALQGLLIQPLLLRQRTRIRLQLALLVALLSLHLFLGYADITGLTGSFPHLMGIHWPLPWLYGPLVFLHIRAIIGKPSSSSRELAHGIPFVTVFLFFLVSFYLSGGDEKRVLYNYIQEAGLPPSVYRFQALAMVHFAAYSIVAFLAFIRYEMYIRNTQSSPPSWKGGHPRILLLSTIFVGTTLLFSSGILSGPVNSPVTLPLLTIVIYLVTIGEIRSLLTGQKKIGDLPAGEEEVTERYIRSRMDEEMMAGIGKKMNQCIEEKRFWLEPEFRLKDLSAAIDVPEHQISQTLNLHLGKTFYRWVNEYRVEEIKNILRKSSGDEINLLTVAFHAGFNSKSTFNAAFKSITGVTPTQFLRALPKQKKENYTSE